MYREQLLYDAKRGDARAQYELAQLYETGDGVPVDKRKAEEWLKLASDGGHAKAQYEMGKKYNNSKIGEELLILASNQGLADAQFELGELYYYKSRKYSKAIHWYTESANHNNKNAQYMLGAILHDESNREDEYKNLRKKREEAFKWFKLSAEQGHFIAQYMLGYYYIYDNGIVKNEIDGFKWFEASAKQGYAKAELELSSCYQHGTGTKVDKKQAAFWYNKTIMNKSATENIREEANKYLKQVTSWLCWLY